MFAKYDSFRDSALHFLCLSGWGTGEFGDVQDYGVYIWRISNRPEDVSTANGEFNSVLSDWDGFEDNGESTDFRQSLVGHFLVSENDQGAVTVREFATEDGLNHRYNEFLNHYNEWSGEQED